MSCAPRHLTLVCRLNTKHIDTIRSKVLQRTQLFLFITCGTLIQIGCTTEPAFPRPDESTLPVPGNQGKISISSVTDVSLTLNWIRASDIYTLREALEYLVYQSTSPNIDTVETMEANGTPLGGYATFTTAMLNVTGLTPSTTYYFNIIVRNSTGGKAAYAMQMLDAAPLAGGGGAISATIPVAGQVNLVWTQATDFITPQPFLQYMVYQSTLANLTTVAQVLANGTAVSVYTAGIGTLTLIKPVAATAYYWNVIAKDAAGNMTAYTQVLK